MKRVFLVFLFVIALSATAFAQTPTPTPVPPADDDRDVVKITTNLIQVDVTVTDAKGRIVTDLKPEEMEIYENGEKQKITNFSFVNSETKTIEKQVSGKNADKSRTLVPAPPVSLRPDQVRRTIALVVDDLSLSFESTHYVRQALQKFVDEQMQPDDLVAIIRTGSGIGALQQFTSDKRQLYAAIERVKWNPAGNGKVGAFAPIGDDKFFKMPGGGSGNAEIDVSKQESFITQLHEDIFTVGTLGAVNYILSGMKTLSGRKNIILFSEGFSLLEKDPNFKMMNLRVVNALEQLTDVANRAGVVIYAMDPRGLQPLNLTAEDDTKGAGFDNIGQKLANRSDDFMDTQIGLGVLAEATGGFLFKNNNDLNFGIQKVLDQPTGYYLVGYQPDDSTFDPKKARFNRLAVKVGRPGLTVRYRSGFFGIADNETKAKTEPESPEKKLLRALSAPFASNDIAVKLTPLFANDARQGSFINTLIHVKTSDLKFTDGPNGSKNASFEIIAAIYGDNGIAVTSTSGTQTLKLQGEDFEKLQKNGIVYSFNFSMKKPGAYQLRVALRDKQTSRVGSANQFIEVPDLKKSRMELSGIVFENFSESDPPPSSKDQKELFHNAAVREFRAGQKLLYSLMVYNTRIDKATGRPKIKLQAKVFKDGKEVFSGALFDYPVKDNNEARQPLSGILQLGKAMEAGEYILQVIVSDELADEKHRLASGWLDFEIVR